MMPGSDLGARLRTAAGRLSVEAPPIEEFVRRGRRRLALRVTSYAVALMLVLAGVGVGLGSLRGLGDRNIKLPGGREIPKPSIQRTIALSGDPSVVVAGDGAIWITDELGTGLFRVDPRTEQVRAVRGIHPEAVSDLALGEGSV